jgi:hypothetical protein
MTDASALTRAVRNRALQFLGLAREVRPASAAALEARRIRRSSASAQT